LPVSARRDRAAIGPLPPLAVLSRFGVGEEAELGQRYDRDGARLGQALIDSLPDDFALDEATVLDFESQAGQTIRHLLSEARSPRELWASDPDPARSAPYPSWNRRRLTLPPATSTSSTR